MTSVSSCGSRVPRRRRPCAFAVKTRPRCVPSAGTSVKYYILYFSSRDRAVRFRVRLLSLSLDRPCLSDRDFFFFCFRFYSAFCRRLSSPSARQRIVMCAAASATACPTMFSHYCCDTWPPRCDYSSYDQLLDVQLYRDNDGRIYCVYVSHTTLRVIRQYCCMYYTSAFAQASIAMRVLMRPKPFHRVFFSRSLWFIIIAVTRQIPSSLPDR